jgi:hypothetical protein
MINSCLRLAIILASGLFQIHMAHAYEYQDSTTCTQDRMYLQADVTELYSEAKMLKSEADRRGIGSQCVQHSMHNFSSWLNVENKKRLKKNRDLFLGYAKCQNRNQDLVKTDIAPCETKELVDLVRFTFNNVMDCVGLDPLNVFPVLSVESGFYLNAASVVGQDLGLGQLTPPAVIDVNQVWESEIAKVRGSSKESCRIVSDLAKTFDPIVPDGPTCQYIAADTNPIRNLLYIGYFLLINKGYVNKLFEQEKILERIEELVQRPLNSEEKRHFVAVMAYLSYNVGYSQMYDTLMGFMQEKEISRNKLKSQLSDISEQLRMAREGYKEAFSSTSYEKKQEVLAEISRLEGLRASTFDTLRKATMTISQFDWLHEDAAGLRSYFDKKGSLRYLGMLHDRAALARNKVKNEQCVNSDFLEWPTVSPQSLN